MNRRAFLLSSLAGLLGFRRPTLSRAAVDGHTRVRWEGLIRRGEDLFADPRAQARHDARLQRAIDAGKLDAGQPIDAAALTAAGVIKSVRDGVRLLARGELKTKINISVAGASKAAAAAVEKAGGSLAVVSPDSGGAAGKAAAEGDAGAESGGE